MTTARTSLFVKEKKKENKKEIILRLNCVCVCRHSKNINIVRKGDKKEEKFGICQTSVDNRSFSLKEKVTSNKVLVFLLLVLQYDRTEY